MIRNPGLALLLTLVWAAPSEAQVILERPTLYRLASSSTFERGCFPPCLCPFMQTAPVTGTFVLELISVGNVFDFYTVRDVRWKVHFENSDSVPIEGSGVYQVSQIADLQAMRVDLVVGNEPETLYQSDYVTGGVDFPQVTVPISINGGFCHDTVITVIARPAPRLFVNRERLSWDPDTEAEANDPRYDVVLGDLTILRASGGDFALATLACIGNSVAGTELSHSDTPLPGKGHWFLHKREGGSYADDDAGQVGSPDAGIALSPGACP